MGQQELGGILLATIQGALWGPDLVEGDRIAEQPLLSRVVVAVDPAKTASNKSDETGIVVCGRGPEPDILRMDGVPPGPDHAYVLADLSGRWSPMEWARLAFDGARDFGADTIIGETNIAGDLVKSNLANYRQQHEDVPTVTVLGSRSRQAKQGRALPVVTLYQQHRVHHVGEVPLVGLESQMYEFRGTGRNDEKDDRVDALTLAVTELDLGWTAVIGRQARVS